MLASEDVLADGRTAIAAGARTGAKGFRRGGCRRPSRRSYGGDRRDPRLDGMMQVVRGTASRTTRSEPCGSWTAAASHVCWKSAARGVSRRSSRTIIVPFQQQKLYERYGVGRAAACCCLDRPVAARDATRECDRGVSAVALSKRTDRGDSRRFRLSERRFTSPLHRRGRLLPVACS